MLDVELPSETEIQKTVFELFDKVKHSYPEDLLSALVPIDTKLEPGDKVITYIPDYLMQELCDFVNGFESMLEKIVDNEQEMRIKVTIYCHIMEADLPFIILWNLLRALNKQQCEWEFTVTNEKGKNIVCEYPKQKIAEIEKLSEQLKLTIGKVIRKFWQKDIRNAFSHSQYFLNGNSFLIPGELSPISRKSNKPLSKSASYSLQDVRGLYLCATNFLSAFINTYKAHIALYKDGNPQRIQIGWIRWDGRWEWVKNL